MLEKIKSSFLPFISFTFLFVMLTAAVAAADDVVIIASKDLPVDSIEKDTLKRIYLGQQTTWDDGTKINFAVLNDRETEETFLKKYLNRSSTRYNRYWRTQIFTGKGKLPQSYKSDDEMIKFVNGNKGAIGFVSSKANTNAVKVLSVR